MSYRLIQRFEPPHRVKVSPFKSFDEAVWTARESSNDYLIEEMSLGVASPVVKKYRIGNFEMD